MVGHSLKEDFAHLKLNEDEYACEIRDISEISFFKRSGGKNHDGPATANVSSSSPLTPASHESSGDSPQTDRYNPFASQKRKLKELADEFLNAKIQEGHHSSIIDARVALALYRTFQLYIE